LHTLFVAATSAFLFVAPFEGSAGLRATALIVTALAIGLRWRHFGAAFQSVPRAVLAAFAAWALLACASLAWSVEPRLTLGELRAEILYGALALGTFYLTAFDDLSRWRAWRLALFAGSAVFLASLVLQETLSIQLTRQTILEQRGPWSTHLVLVAPLLFALGWPPPWGDSRPAWLPAGALALLIWASWDTGNRIMWVAFGAQLLLAMASWRAVPSMDTTRSRDLRRITAAAVLVVATAFGASLVEHTERYFGAQAPLAVSFERDLRPQIWSAALRTAGAAPWLGHGFGREIVAPVFIPLTPPFAGHPQLRHAHNVLELGIVGLAVFVALLLALAREYRGYLRRADIAPLGVLGLSLLAGFVVKNLTDDFMHRHNALVFWALNGALLGLARGQAARRSGADAPATGIQAPSA
jgi:O-antigen ligase